MSIQTGRRCDTDRIGLIRYPIYDHRIEFSPVTYHPSYLLDRTSEVSHIEGQQVNRPRQAWYHTSLSSIVDHPSLLAAPERPRPADPIPWRQSITAFDRFHGLPLIYMFEVPPIVQQAGWVTLVNGHALCPLDWRVDARVGHGTWTSLQSFRLLASLVVFDDG